MSDVKNEDEIDPNAIDVRQYKEETPEKAVSRTFLQPSLNASRTIKSMYEKVDKRHLTKFYLIIYI